MKLQPGIGRIIQLHKRIKELKAALKPFAHCRRHGLMIHVDKDEGVKMEAIADCGECDGCKAKKELEKK